MRKFAILLFMLFALPTLGIAADYYASPTGSGAACSVESPCAIATAMSRASSAGDRVLAADGTYNLSATVQTAGAGTSGSRNTLSYYQTVKGPVFNFGGNNVNGITLSHAYWTVDGITVTNTGYSGIKADGDDDGTTSDRDYGNYGNYGERNYRANGLDGLVIQNCYVHTIGFDGIKIGHLNDIQILNNEVYNCGTNGQQQGIDLVGVYTATIRGNYVHDGPDGAMNIGIFWKGGSQEVTCERNIVENMVSPNAGIEAGGDTEWYNTRYTASLVANANLNTDILSESTEANEIDEVGGYSGTYEAQYMAEDRNSIIRNNIIINCDPGISTRNAYNIKIYHNTLIETGWTQRPLKLWNDGNAAHPSVGGVYYNNLVYNSTNDVAVATIYQFKDTSALSASDYNLYYSDGQTLSAGSGGGQDTHSILNTDPSIDGSYKPDSESDPGVNTGYDLLANGVISVAITDYDGSTRPVGAGYDIGAHEYGAGAVSSITGISITGGSFR